MSKRFASISEEAAAPIFESAGCISCQSFAPQYQTEFTDKRGFVFTGKPDFYHAASDTYFEAKFCELATPQSHEASENKLRSQYRYHIGNDTGLKYHEVSAALWNSRWRNDCLLFAWNHCLSKHLVVQEALGRERYCVVFGTSLAEKTESRYRKKGLHFIYLSQLNQYLTPTEMTLVH